MFAMLGTAAADGVSVVRDMMAASKHQGGRAFRQVFGHSPPIQ